MVHAKTLEARGKPQKSLLNLQLLQISLYQIRVSYALVVARVAVFISKYNYMKKKSL
jgi:hypothetical protein